MIKTFSLTLDSCTARELHVRLLVVVQIHHCRHRPGDVTPCAVNGARRAAEVLVQAVGLTQGVYLSLIHI